MSVCIINIDDVFCGLFIPEPKSVQYSLVIFCFIDFFPFYIQSSLFSELIQNISFFVCFTANNSNMSPNIFKTVS